MFSRLATQVRSIHFRPVSRPETNRFKKQETPVNKKQETPVKKELKEFYCKTIRKSYIKPIPWIDRYYGARG